MATLLLFVSTVAACWLLVDSSFVRGVNYVQPFMDWDASVIDQELGYAHGLFGFTSIPFFLSTIVYRHNPAAFLQKWDTFLLLCAKHGLSVLPVAFDRDFPSCTCTTANGSSCTTGPGGCITPDDAFITSGNYRNSS